MSVLSLVHAESPELARADTLARLRRQMAVLSGTPDRRSAEPDDRMLDVLRLPGDLADLFPGKGIARGSVVSCTGARSLVAAVIAAATESGAHVGIVGLPRLSLLSIAEMGADLGRVATIPDPGADPVEIASILLDGMDLVVLGLRGIDVAPARCRVVMGRVRQQASVLLVVGGHWPGAQMSLDAQVLTYRHLPGAAGGADLSAARCGHGRIGGMRLRVTVHGRDRRRRSADIDVRATGSGAISWVGAARSDIAFGSGYPVLDTHPAAVAN
ncbi:MAG: hypothetical protein QM673_06185 [Gordonia sp. (in: high G+C Gram-positive bacteria)]